MEILTLNNTKQTTAQSEVVRAYKKKGHEAWQLALKISKRKYTMWKPIAIVNHNTVRVYGLIYGNEWNYTLDELKLLEGK